MKEFDNSLDANQIMFEEVQNILVNKTNNLDKGELKGRMEALIFASGDPVSIKDLTSFLELVPDAVEQLIDEMIIDYENSNRGIRLVRIDDTISLVTKVEYSDTVKRLAKVNERQSLSQGALECLAIIAYRQPVTRVEIDEIRGVSSEYVLNRLLEKNIIKVAGRKDAPGKPRLYATTDEFLLEFGFSDLKDFKENEEHKALISGEQISMEEINETEQLNEIKNDNLTNESNTEVTNE